MLIVYPVSAWNFEVPLLGIKLGTQDYQVNGTFENFGHNVTVKSDMTMDKVTWFIDGYKVREDYNVKSSKYIAVRNDLREPERVGDIIQYKAGRDPVTKKQRHRVSVVYDGGERSWIIQE